MANSEYIRVKDGHLEIRQKVTKGKLSASGKSTVVVSTGGFTEVEGDDIRVNLTAIRKV